jgi:hypothetical protein
MYGKLDPMHWPIGAKWEELKFLVNELERYSRALWFSAYVSFRVIVNASVFADKDLPHYEFVVLKREGSASFEVLGVYTDIDTAVGVVKLLVGTIKEELQ